jgi:GT2 family glycosyltransferase
MACDIIVVENGSIDESDAILASYGERIVVLKQEKNLGFAGGVNVGIRYAMEHGCEYIALFNNDAVAEPEWLGELAKELSRNKSLGAVTGKILYMDKRTIDSTGDFYCVSGIPFPRGRKEIDRNQYDDCAAIFSPCAGAALYRTEAFDTIGLFDEAYFAYLEDIDFGFRLQLGGWLVRYVPTGVAYHHVSATSSKLGDFAISQYARNFLLLYVKNMPGPLIIKYLPRMLYRYGRMFAAKIIRGGVIAYGRGFWQFFGLLPHAMRERRRIQSSKKVSVRHIDRLLWHGKPGRFQTDILHKDSPYGPHSN